MSLLDDWRVLAIGAAVLWGFWGFFAKVATERLDWRTALVFVVATHCVVIMSSTIWQAKWGISRWHVAAIAAGCFGGIGAILMYRAFEKASGSLAIAVSAQYVLVTALLSWLLLNEHLGLRRIVGIVLAVVAVVLLSWGEPKEALVAPTFGPGGVPREGETGP